MNVIGWHRDLHLKRSREIAGVLIGHGWDSLCENFGLPGLGLAHLNRQRNAPTRPEHLRCALEELGTTFIKPGQILSTRADLLPPEYLAELSKLQDVAPSVPFEAVRNVLIAELGQPVKLI